MPHADPAAAKAWRAEWTAKNREKLRAQGRNWSAENRDPEAQRIYLKEWKAKNRERARALNRDYEARHPELIKARRKAKYAKNKHKVRHELETNREVRLRHLYYSAKCGARARGLEFDILFDEIVWPETCPVLGIPLSYDIKWGKRRPDSPSLDRTDNDRGYVSGNVVVMSWRANEIKRNSTVDEVKKLLSYLVKAGSK